VTRADAKIFAAVRRASGKLARAAKFHENSGVITLERNREVPGKGNVLVVSAGTSDIPVAEEALLTAQMMGNRAEHLYDVGVAGIHRLLEHREKLTQARVIVCVAGMEGALPSVVGGLVAVPVIAVPTSTGYGASFGGVAALLGMLNSCASNVTVVNIDNGFGAACVASCINRL
jgi:NCAIR mutase (PurE)-related protein